MDEMKICAWNQNYTVGVPVLDRHHQKLFDILNDLYVLMRDGSEDQAIIRVIDELLDYTHYHFDEEEKVMEQIKYPELISHRQLHQKFVTVVKELHAKSHNGMAIFLATKVSNARLGWLKTHIRGVDKKYHDYMKLRGVDLDH
ncbi:MAG: bacteriohemerythrin [Methylococcales bacterium]|nr:bacteriohemerythrin [Methylococcales bacterium]